MTISQSQFVNTMLKIKNNVKSIVWNVRIGNQRLSIDDIFVYSNLLSVKNVYKADLQNAKNCLFIIDESCDMLKDHEVAEEIRNSNNYFIIICRKLIGWLPLSVDSIYELQEKHGVFYNVPSFCNSNSELS